MPKSKLEVEVERESAMENIEKWYGQLTNPNPNRRCYTSHDIVTLRWMLQHNIGKLKKLPLPDIELTIRAQLELVEKVKGYLASDRDESLSLHCLGLRRRLAVIEDTSADHTIG